MSLDAKVDALFEDVGRHNAVDKVIGRLLLRELLPASRGVLVVTSRASFEIVQKACMAQMPFVICLSAPTSLAVRTAQRFAMTLIGFVRERGFNVYSGAERIVA
jgi:FdhD protein